jgi:hypothetical protein
MMGSEVAVKYIGAADQPFAWPGARPSLATRPDHPCEVVPYRPCEAHIGKVCAGALLA